MKKAESSSMFVNEVDLLDCAYFDADIGIVGASYFVDVILRGQTDENGFVEDFSKVKNAVKTCLKDTLDHALLVPSQSSHVQNEESSQPGHSNWTIETIDKRKWNYTAPENAVYCVDTLKITKTTIEEALQHELKAYLPGRVSDISIQLRPESANNKEVFFTYTHGLPGHEGLCQRLFHGHRSKIEIEVEGVRRHDLEKTIVSQYFADHVHIATPEQIVEGGYTRLEKKSFNLDPIKLKYRGNLGGYEASFPPKSVFVVECATSIESITMQIAKLVKDIFCTEDETVSVYCYEGINKGSIARL